MTLVGIYAESSPSSVSMTGIPVMDPHPSPTATFAHLSNNRECKKNTSPGKASLAGGLLSSRESYL
jgi:hypothetical protein